MAWNCPPPPFAVTAASTRIAVLVDILDQFRSTDLEDDQAIAIAADRNSRLSDFDELFK